MNKDKCLCAPTEILIFPCSGGSNVGQISNAVAVELTKQGKGEMYCLAGIGGHISGLIESTKAAKKLVAIDGCPVKCAKKTLEHAGFVVNTHIVVTELGITKSPKLDVKDEGVNVVLEHLNL